MKLRSGITTGTCAAAAAQAATAALVGHPVPTQVDVRLPSGATIRVPIRSVDVDDSAAAATAVVQKDAGDDPDVTHGLEIHAHVSWHDSAGILFVAGEGVGTVTKPGLQVLPGEPAINPVPRQMITAAIRGLTPRGVRVEIAIPGGREMAAETFNPRLGIEGGLSILGTTGIVRPYCKRALRDALKCTLDVAAACGVTTPVLVPGNIGAKAARARFPLGEEQLIEVGNEWRFILRQLPSHPLRAVMVLGHPGKLAKLAARQWDTHSARSTSALPLVAELCREVLAHVAPETPTTEGLFAALDGAERKTLADALARRIRFAVAAQLAVDVPIAVWLVDMAGQAIGADGDFSPWASLPPPTPRERASRDEPAEGDEKVAAANVVPSALTSSPSPGTVQGMVSGPAESLADITIVGCGPGAPDYVTPVARRAVARAEIVVGSPRLLQLFPEAPPARILVGADISAVLDQMAAVAGGRNLVVLVSGDAGLYSLSQNVVSRFGWARCTVIPGISSLQVAFARLGLDWADVRVLSAHGRWPAIAAAELALVPKIAILAGGATGLHYAAQVAAALQTSHAVFLCENLTLEDERVQSMTAEELAQCDAASLAIVLIIRRSLIL